MGDGSSPRIRGECYFPFRDVPEPGIIPANTGRISNGDETRLVQTDHPREYGENRNHHRSCTSQCGSSPRIRGEFTLMITFNLRGRIIPANTGRIATMSKLTLTERDHPREYGENDFPANFPVHQ